MDTSELQKGQKAIHEEIQSLSGKRNSEISYYLASVLNETLNGLVSVEQSAELSHEDLVALVRGYEKALDDAVDIVAKVLNQRRVVNQIAASKGKTPDKNGWDRTVPAEQIINFSNKSIGDQRKEVSRKYQKVNEINFTGRFAEGAVPNNTEEAFKEWYTSLNFNQENRFYCHAAGLITMNMMQALIDAATDGKQGYVTERLNQTTY
jgi:aspartate ammonia-lyase